MRPFCPRQIDVLRYLQFCPGTDMPELLSKTEQGVKRSRESWFGKVASLFNRPKIEEETWDELEELLIAADVGVANTEQLIQSVKQRVKVEKLSESSQGGSA